VTRLRDLVRFQRARRLELPAWLERVVSLGIVSRDPAVVRRQKIANLVSYAAAINALARCISYFFYEFEGFWYAEAFGFTLFVWAILIHRLHRFGNYAAATALILWYLTGILFTATVFGLRTHVQAFFVLSGVMLFLFGVENWRLFLFWFVLVFLVMLGVLHYAPEQGVVPDPRLVASMGMQTMLTAVTINGLVIFYALYVLWRTEKELESENRRAEALVSVVLPEPIARRLRSGNETRIADRIEGASVLFADLVSFTAAAHDASPEQVVDYLDEFVRGFDLMCESYGVEKIKTIGDSYMAAGGLNGRARDDAIMIGRLAQEMMRAQERRPALAGRKLQLRIGIHYGTAIAGVIGDTRIAYDLWGDAVNVASRMESYGVPGRIQVSEQYREAVGDAFEFEERGTTDMKGIGCARTFFLLRSREQALDPGAAADRMQPAAGAAA
jgi:adenylate cyclase